MHSPLDALALPKLYQDTYGVALDFSAAAKNAKEFIGALPSVTLKSTNGKAILVWHEQNANSSHEKLQIAPLVTLMLRQKW